MGTILDQIRQAEEHATHGLQEDARAVLERLERRRIPREQLARVAKIARRAAFPHFAIRLLNPLVRPSRRTRLKASAAERAEYGSALEMIGAMSEAREVLDSVSPKDEPRVLLLRGLASLTNWESEVAVPNFREFLLQPGLSPYLVLAGKLRLARALLHGTRKWEETQNLLDEVIAESGPTKNRFLYKDALLYSLRRAYFAEDHADARRWLARIEMELPGESTAFHLNVAMWRTLLQLRETASGSPGRAAALERLHKLRDELSRCRFSEMVRMLDYHKGMTLGDSRLLTHLYFGSPFPSFRRRIQGNLEAMGAPPPPEYEWNLPRGGSHRVKIDITNGINNVSNSHLKEGQLLQRTLAALASDFYRPLSIGELHERVYPGEYFNPLSSPDRVRKACERLGAWLEKNGIPLQTRVAHHRYEVVSRTGCTLKITVPPGNRPTVRLQRLAADLRRSLRGRSFSVPDAAAAWGISERSASRHLKAGVESGLVRREGRGAAIRYRIPD